MLFEKGRGLVGDRGAGLLVVAQRSRLRGKRGEHDVADGGVERVVVQSRHGPYGATPGRCGTAVVSGGGPVRKPPPRPRWPPGPRPPGSPGPRRRRDSSLPPPASGQPGAQAGDQISVAGAVLRHRVDPPVHLDPMGSAVMPEHRVQVLQCPRPQVVVGVPRAIPSAKRPNDRRTSSARPEPPFPAGQVMALACNDLRSPRGPRTAEGTACRLAGPAPAPPREATGTPSATMGRRRGRIGEQFGGAGAGSATTTASARQRAPVSSESSQPRSAACRPVIAVGSQRRPLRATSWSTSTR